MSILVTGSAGFIGSYLSKYYLDAGETVIGIDNLNDYYDVRLKKSRLERLTGYPNFHFYEADICDAGAVQRLFADHCPKRVVHLAAQAGVRYSIANPHKYVQSNLVGFTHVLDACRQYGVEHFVYASSSSVYGANTAQPFQESHSVNHPLSIYAATKKANELIAHSYSYLYQLPTTGLRFFTVYGPWGRPDMAFFSFTKAILAGTPICVYNEGQMRRDFTYIDDIIEGIIRAVEQPAQSSPDWSSDHPDPATSFVPYRIYNIGAGNPVNLMDYIGAIEAAAGMKAKIEFMPLQPGDVVSTFADTTFLKNDLGYSPSVQIDEGVKRFVDWYKAYYHID